MMEEFWSIFAILYHLAFFCRHIQNIYKYNHISIKHLLRFGSELLCIWKTRVYSFQLLQVRYFVQMDKTLYGQ